MDKKRYALIVVVMLMAALCGGAISGKFLTPTGAQAQAVAGAPKMAGGQKWEYCSLTKAAYVASNRGGLYWISYFRDSGVQVVEVEDTALERNGPAKALARLGEEGWEMVGAGPLDIRQGELKALYFKRPKP
jgi:hypothetical protein